MKILVVIPNLGTGGAERLIVTWLSNLNLSKYEVKVCIFEDNLSLAPEIESLGIEIYNLNLSHKWSILEALFKLLKLLYDFKPDIIWSHLFFGILYSRISTLFYKKTSVISVLHDNPESNYLRNTKFQKLKFYIYDKTRSLDYKTIAVSNFTREKYEEVLGWKKLEVIENCISLAKINKVINSLDVTKRDESIFTIVVPGRLVVAKGHKYLIEAIEKIIPNLDNEKKINVLFIGDGPLRFTLQTMIENKNLGSYFKIVDAVPQSKLFEYFRLANLVVIPSVSEPFGLVAVEAMYIGVPVIVSKVGGLQYITEHNIDSLQFETQNSLDLSYKILEILNNPVLAKDLSENSIISAKKFDVKARVKDWEFIFDEVKLKG
tara:strand:+ start:194 stop:1321 length:1128 start_codon:yes stop_codon:yes gene_type:complete